MPEVTKKKFIVPPGPPGCNNQAPVSYRTGDRGVVDPMSSHLHILGRIGGEEGMVKIHGVRIELGEIEQALLDPVEITSSENPLQLVLDCVVKVEVVDEEEGSKKLYAYCVISGKCLRKIGINSFPETNNGIGTMGIICPPCPLLTVLRARCSEKVRKGSTPSTFIIIDRIPLSRTGKVNRKSLPTMENCVTLEELVPQLYSSAHLSEYGRCGKFITQELTACLNLHPSQKKMITTTANFAQLGKVLYYCIHEHKNRYILLMHFISF